MTIKELIEKLGVDSEHENTVKDFLNGSYVPKARFNEVNEENKTLKSKVTNLEDLNKKVATLEQEKNKAIEDLNSFKFDTSIKGAIQDAQDADIILGLLDKSKIINKDGKLEGLEEQIIALKQNKPFLFKQEQKQEPKQPHNPKGNGKGDGEINPFKKETENLTMQAQLLNTDPEKARLLASEAGVTLNF